MLVGVGVGVGVAVIVGDGVTVTVGVSVAVGVEVGVVIRSTTPKGAKRSWNTVAMTTAKGKMIILRYWPNFGRTAVRKSISLAQSS